MTETHAFCLIQKLALLAVLSLPVGAAAQSYQYYTSMPPYPTNPKDYVSKWDPFMLQLRPRSRDPLLVTPKSAKVSMNVDILPANGRQIARDSLGTWFVLVEKDRQSLFLATGRGPRVAGADLSLVELVGSEPTAVLPGPGEVAGASMVVDGRDQLHIVWGGKNGLWYVMANVKGAAPEKLRDKQSWAGPRQLVKTACHPGDIMLDARGNVVVCYSHGDTVYYMSIADGKVEAAAGLGAGMPALGGTSISGEGARPEADDAKPTAASDEKAQPGKKPSYPPPLPFTERECQEAVMDLAPDGTVYLAFRRDFEIWVARRTNGVWLPAERAARGQSFHPSIVVVGGRPLVCFQYEGIKSATLGGERYLNEREGGGSRLGFTTLTEDGWRTGCLAKSEEIIVARRGIWDRAYEGNVLPMVEQLGWPVLLRDRHGVAWALWQNTTRRWAYCARWMGEEFGQVQECRGPFNAPSLPMTVEKHMPATATDVGVLFFAADRVIFDRVKIPTLSVAQDREVMFLDSLEVGGTSGVDFVLNQMTKHPANPLLSPGPPGSKDDRHVRIGSVRKHGATYVMHYTYQSWDDEEWKHDGLAISTDGIHWQKVEKLPADLPPPDPRPDADNPVRRGYFDNPDQSDPAKKFMRTIKCGEVGWAKGSYRVQYSPDGKHWTDGPETSVLNALREGARPNLWDPLDIPERRIKIYGRAYSPTFRSCGMMWSSDLLHWAGAEHFLDPDDPYGTPPVTTPKGRPVEEAYTMRGQIFLDACAGKGEDQIYSIGVAIVEGLYLCHYVPCDAEMHMERALAVSRDGFNFTRVKNGERTLPVGPPGSWDAGWVFGTSTLREGDTLRVYYEGTTCHHGTDGLAYPAIEVGLATIRVNGWTYYTPRPDRNRGTVTTIPIQAPAGARRGLTVNIEGGTGHARPLVVEVLDAATGKPIKGFSAADCIHPKRDGLAVPVTWKGGQALPTGKDIRLRFHLQGKGVRLYSFGFRTVD